MRKVDVKDVARLPHVEFFVRCEVQAAAGCMGNAVEHAQVEGK
jgi:hypothetical protein